MSTKARAGSVGGTKPTRRQRRLADRTQPRWPASLPENAGEAATPRLALKRADLILVLTLITAALVLFLYRLGVPSVYQYDEIYHAFTADQYLLGNPESFAYYTHPLPPAVMYTWNHPPAGLWLIAAGIKLFGNHSFGWRVMSAVFGAAGIAVAYLLALHLSRSRMVGALTSGLLLVSGLYMVQARVAMLDIFVTVFVMSALLGFYLFLTASISSTFNTANPRKVRWPLVLTGVFIGLGVATKWNAAYPAVFMGLFALYRLYKLLRACQARRPRPEALSAFNEHLIWIPVGFIAVPLAVYLLAYAGYFHSGHSWDEFVRQQRLMLYYHSHLKAAHPYSSQWWGWPLDLRPVRYSSAHGFGIVEKVYAAGNPLLFWGMVPAVLWVCYRWYRERNVALAILVIGFFGSWLPWILVSRAAFIYHFLPAVPFGCLAVAAATKTLWDRAGWRRATAIAYVSLVLASFAFFYPVYTGLPISPHAFDLRMWLPSWR